MRKKQPIVIFRKLGQHAVKGHEVHGFAHFEENIIEVDPTLSPYEKFHTLIHERNHLLHPDWSETKVIRYSRTMALFLWGMGYRETIL